MLERLLLSGARPGDRLPTETELARAYGVSRPTARQALQALAYAGLIEAKPRRGTRLKAPDPAALAPLFGAHLALAAASGIEGPVVGILRSVAEARGVLEIAVLPLAAQRRTAADLEALEQAERRLAMASLEDTVERIAADAEFHRALMGSAHNPVLTGLAQLSDGYFRLQARVHPHAPARNLAAAARRTALQHRYIRKALEARDAGKAGRVLARHLEPTLRTRARNPELKS